jgi:arylsulfatase A-like enzyme
MTRHTRLAAVVLIGGGLLLGHAAATGRFGPGRAAIANEKPAPTDDRAAPDKLDRTTLPIPEPKRESITEADARKAKTPPRFEVKAPKGAPNVVIVLIDDMGFGQSSAFGGPINMPTCKKLADNGLRYNRFHTTALCSPTRIALLTGRNHHSCNMGSITETATSFPGQTGSRPENIAPLAEMLRLNG